MKNNILHIFGLGSPYGLDPIGWQLVDHLAKRLGGQQVEFQAVREPSRLPGQLLELSSVILIDAMQQDFGELRWVNVERLDASNSGSSHALPLAEIIRMSQELNPQLQVEILGVGIGNGTGDINQLFEQVMPGVEVMLNERLALG